MLGIFYPLEKRADGLMRILKFSDRIRREIELKEFVTQEKAMLIGMVRTLQMENIAIIPPLTPDTDETSCTLKLF